MPAEQPLMTVEMVEKAAASLERSVAEDREPSKRFAGGHGDTDKKGQHMHGLPTTGHSYPGPSGSLQGLNIGAPVVGFDKDETVDPDSLFWEPLVPSPRIHPGTYGGRGVSAPVVGAGGGGFVSRRTVNGGFGNSLGFGIATDGGVPPSFTPFTSKCRSPGQAHPFEGQDGQSMEGGLIWAHAQGQQGVAPGAMGIQPSATPTGRPVSGMATGHGQLLSLQGIMGGTAEGLDSGRVGYRM
ncbi:unnamed protein product, partial [Discosporangium mesarthrocarpum]